MYFDRGAADKVVSGQGKLEHLVVGAQEIAASTAQLVVASRVKADRKSQNLVQLSQASKGVTNATGGVVATVKDCSQLMDEDGEILYINNCSRCINIFFVFNFRVRYIEYDLTPSKTFRNGSSS